MPSLPVGQRFSLTYLERGAPLRDSVRMRRRLEQRFVAMAGDWQDQSRFGRHWAQETGAAVPRSQNGATYYPALMFEQGELRDILDVVTVFYTHLRKLVEATRQFGPRVAPDDDPEVWKAFVTRVFTEENLGYRIDAACGVHLHVDAEFEHARASTLAVLGHSEFSNARVAFEDAFRHLDSSPRDTKAAVRSIFESAEILAKQICPEAQNLNTKMIGVRLKPLVLQAYPGDATENRVWEGLLSGMSEWVTALHNYRHGQAADEPVAPSVELAVFVLSSGCTYVRGLADVALKLKGKST